MSSDRKPHGIPRADELNDDQIRALMFAYGLIRDREKNPYSFGTDRQDDLESKRELFITNFPID